MEVSKENIVNLVAEIKDLNFNDSVAVLDKLYHLRYTLSGYYEAYSYVCEKFDYHKPLLPKKEYRWGI